jgi:hypothetical protein
MIVGMSIGAGLTYCLIAYPLTIYVGNGKRPGIPIIIGDDLHLNIAAALFFNLVANVVHDFFLVSFHPQMGKSDYKYYQNNKKEVIYHRIPYHI